MRKIEVFLHNYSVVLYFISTVSYFPLLPAKSFAVAFSYSFYCMFDFADEEVDF